MQAWLGRPRGVPAVDPDLPRAVRRVQAAFPAGFLVNRLVAPRDEDGSTIFYVEEQGVWLWAIATEELEADDPPVWGRENEPGRSWQREAPDLSTFIVQMAVLSAAMTAPHSASAGWLAATEAERALTPLVDLELPSWRWPGDPVRWYAGDDAVAFTCPNHYPGDEDDPHVSLWLGAISAEGVRFVEPHLSDAWDSYRP